MGKKILVVDDNEQDRKIMKRLLNDAGYTELVFAERGEEAVTKVGEENPDLVVTDTILPGLDGFEVCRLIRETHGREKPKVIIMTGICDAVDAVKARRAGADDYAVKTSDCASIITAINNLLNVS